MTQVAKRPKTLGMDNVEPIRKYDSKKRYHFQLVQTHEKCKPRDRDTGEMLDSPYPPIYILPNSGVAFNKETSEFEHCRYVFGYNSIWVKDQVKPEPTKGQIIDSKNDIVFRNGSLFVQGNNTALLDLLHSLDLFEGIEEPLMQTPPVYRLLSEDKTRQSVRLAADKAYEAEKAAREADLVDMLPVANAFGIDVDFPEENEDRIRTEFILKAKQNPEGFLRLLVDPKAKYKFNITMALRENIISADVIPGKLVLVETGKAYLDLKAGDIADQFAAKLAERDSNASSLYNTLETIMSKEQ